MTLASASCWFHDDSQPGGVPTTLLLAPGQDEPNSNLAEMAALIWALEHTDKPVIATDSLTCMQQIAGYLARPHRYHYHPLRGCLERLVRTVCDRVARGIQHTSIVKVTAHTGILGNEMADWFASSATRHPHEASVWTPPDHTRIAELWHMHPDGTRTRLRDTSNKLRHLVRAAHALGSANTDGIYFRSYQAVASNTHQSSHHFLSAKAVPWGARRLALRLRGGGIYNNKLAKRFGLTDSSTCPLCPLEDGQTHMLLACQHPDMHNMHCKRHNMATRMVLAETLRHDLGATVVQSHVGTDDAVATALDGVPNQIPGVSGDLPRPDFTLHVPATADRPARLLVTELKYGADTRLEQKYDTVAQLLAPTLRAAERHYRCNSTLLTFSLGVGGRIPLQAYEHLAELGIPRRAAHNLCNHLNILAIQWLHKIVAGRRALAPVEIRHRRDRNSGART